MSITNAPKDYKQSPSKEYRFFLYDPNDGLTFWKDEEKRDKAAEAAIDSYLDDDGWSEEVTLVVAGMVTHQTVETDVKKRAGAVDEDGYDEEGELWDNDHFAYKCNYALRPFCFNKESGNE